MTKDPFLGRFVAGWKNGHLYYFRYNSVQVIPRLLNALYDCALDPETHVALEDIPIFMEMATGWKIHLVNVPWSPPHAD